MKYLFKGGVLDGQEYGEESGLGMLAGKPYLYVPVENGQWVDPPHKIVKHFQVYIRKGNVYELRTTPES